jgi:hypothetical protein
MKILKILILIFVFFLNEPFTKGQDTTLYKLKISRYESADIVGELMFTAGFALATCTGLVETWILQPLDRKISKKDQLIISSVALALIVPGLIDIVVSKHKIKEYKIKLDSTRSGFYYGPNQVGLKLAFKF